MCSAWVVESSEFYSRYDKSLLDRFSDVQTEELNPKEVLDKIKNGDKPDVMIMDSTLPFVSTKILIDKVREANPKVEFILTASSESGSTLIGDKYILPKPFFVSDFIQIFGDIKEKVKASYAREKEALQKSLL